MPKPQNDIPPAGRRLLYWLATAAAQVRKDAQVRAEPIAAMLDVSVETVRRFEKAQHWPSQVDRFIAAYAQVGGLADPREIYQQALDLWYEHGAMPLVSAKDDAALTGGQRFEQAIVARRARPRAPRATAGKTSATPKRKAGS